LSVLLIITTFHRWWMRYALRRLTREDVELEELETDAGVGYDVDHSIGGGRDHYYAVIYTGRKDAHIYINGLIREFLEDEEES
jgi:hypothetical protein